MDDTTATAEIARLKAEVERLHAFTMVMAERIAAASEVLGRLAEKKTKRGKCWRQERTLTRCKG